MVSLVELLNITTRKLNRYIEKKRYHKYDVKKTKQLVLPKLTSEEYKELKNTWSCFKINKKDVIWARVYKKYFGFDPYYISVGYHCALIKKVLNPEKQNCSLENKALVDVWFPEIPFPKALIRCINNVLYDSEMNKISFEQAVSFLREKKQFIIKPALDSMQGNGVKKIDIQQTNASNEWFKTLFNNATKNFIVQDVVIQHPDVARLNPTSLNCCRITTIYIDGKFTYAAMLKIGKKGSHVDNWHSSYLVGINNEGFLNNVGWDNSIHSVNKTDNGILFGGIKYPYFDGVISTCKKYHKKYFPQCGIIGWDVIIDINNKPVIIEANMVDPGLSAEQLCSGPFFKEVLDEVVKKIKV